MSIRWQRRRCDGGRGGRQWPAIPGIALALALALPFTLAHGQQQDGKAAADGKPAGEEILAPTDAHRQSTRAIVQLMQRRHYHKTLLDDELGSRVLDRYFDTLDPNHSVFYESDIDEFAGWRPHIDDVLQRGLLEPAFEIFERYRMRMEERAAVAAGFIDHEFDFTRDEEIILDRSEISRPQNNEEADDYWRRLVKNHIIDLELSDKPADEIPETLRERYARMERRVHQTKSDDVVQYFLTAYTQSIDPHSSYLSPPSSENFRIQLSLKLEGIGAALQTVGEHTVVRRIVPGGPAERDGRLRVDDRIVGLRQDDETEMTDIVGWRLQDVINRIRGKKGTRIHFDLLRDDEPVSISLVRDRVQLQDRKAKRKLREGEDENGARRRIGIIELPSFYLDFAGRGARRDNYNSTSRDMTRLIGELREEGEGIDGLIIDIRGNQGGSLDEALLVAGLFIPSGPVVQVRDAVGNTRVRGDTDPSVVWKGPLVVLMDRRSASASEIFAGAMQDYRRAIIVGEPTYGKGTVQNLVDLPRHGGTGRLKLTVAQYFRVNGDGVQRRGVVPDIDLTPATGESPFGERTLDGALPWKRIEPARWDAAERNEETVAVVRERSLARLEEREDFRLLREVSYNLDRDIEALSLVRDERVKEHEEFEAERKQLRKALNVAVVFENEKKKADEAKENADDADEASSGDEDKDKGGGSASLPNLRNEIMLQEAVRVMMDYLSAMGPDAATNSGVARRN